MESVEPNAETKMTLVTLVRSQKAESKTTPGTEAVFRRETTSEPVMAEKPRVRAKPSQQVSRHIARGHYHSDQLSLDPYLAGIVRE